MKNKKKKILVIILIILLLITGAIVTIVLLNKDDKNNSIVTTTEAKEEPTTETVVEEESTIETTEAEDTGATQATTESPAKPESDTEVPAQSATTEAPAPSAPTEPAPSAPTAPTTEEPKHEHNWVWVKTKDASKVWVVDQAAYIEYKEHPEEWHWWTGYACHYDGCGMLFDTSTEANAHSDSYAGIDDYHSCAGYGSATRKVVDKPAWTEEIPHEEVGHWAETPEEGYYKCDCGATK